MNEILNVDGMIKSYLCNLCKLNEHCQHNFDYECQEVFNQFRD
ncbi:hypothetical protein LCGC14_0795870 [marine sediment metagenome]|uniref:Uncharacterized protein n=1 Tax=marine sediment metagenome TaxID=412755 RepID=A0A0F9SYG0_9ZZZZ